MWSAGPASSAPPSGSVRRTSHTSVLLRLLRLVLLRRIIGTKLAEGYANPPPGVRPENQRPPLRRTAFAELYVAGLRRAWDGFFLRLHVEMPTVRVPCARSPLRVTYRSAGDPRDRSDA